MKCSNKIENKNTIFHKTKDNMQPQINKIIHDSILLWRKNPTATSWNEILNKMPLTELYVAIYNNNNISLEILKKLDDMFTSSIQFYEKETFNDYITSKLQGCSQNDYTKYIQNSNDPVFKNNLYSKYQKQEQIKSMKNYIVQEILRHSPVLQTK
jgi:hypothetical protein